MRIWLAPDKLAKLKLTPADVIGAIRQQNIQAPAGQIGAAPSKPDQEFTYTVRAPGKFSTPEEFGEVSCARPKTAGRCGSRMSPGWNWEASSTNHSAG
jgi:multidrug efflux pump subunit AcrB